MKSQMGKVQWEVGWKNIQAPLCPKEWGKQSWAVFVFRRVTGNAALLGGNLDKMSGQLISVIARELGPV